MTVWRVFTSWRAVPDRVLGLWAGSETCREHPSWVAARHDALQTACLYGARYITVQDHTDVVVGEYDAYTNRWQQYPGALVDVDHTTEVTDEPCHVGRGVVLGRLVTVRAVRAGRRRPHGSRYAGAGTRPRPRTGPVRCGGTEMSTMVGKPAAGDDGATDDRAVIAEALRRWALMYPIPAWGLAEGETAERLANNWAQTASQMVVEALAEGAARAASDA